MDGGMSDGAVILPEYGRPNPTPDSYLVTCATHGWFKHRAWSDWGAEAAADQHNHAYHKPTQGEDTTA